jgi:hypothetical protein
MCWQSYLFVRFGGPANSNGSDYFRIIALPTLLYHEMRHKPMSASGWSIGRLAAA